MDSPAGKAIGGLIHRLAVSRGAGEHKDEAKEKGKENDPDEKVETGFSKYLSMRFKKPPLRTPDYDEHYHFGSLRGANAIVGLKGRLITNQGGY